MEEQKQKKRPLKNIMVAWGGPSNVVGENTAQKRGTETTVKRPTDLKTNGGTGSDQHLINATQPPGNYRGGKKKRGGKQKETMAKQLQSPTRNRRRGVGCN